MLRKMVSMALIISFVLTSTSYGMPMERKKDTLRAMSLGVASPVPAGVKSFPTVSDITSDLQALDQENLKDLFTSQENKDWLKMQQTQQQLKVTFINMVRQKWNEYLTKNKAEGKPEIKPPFDLSDPNAQEFLYTRALAEFTNLTEAGKLGTGHLGRFDDASEISTAGIREFLNILFSYDPNSMYNDFFLSLLVKAEAEFLKSVHEKQVKKVDAAIAKYGGIDKFVEKIRQEWGEEQVAIVEEMYTRGAGKEMTLSDIIEFNKTHIVKLVGGEVRPHTARFVEMEARILAAEGINVVTMENYTDSVPIYVFSFLTNLLGACGATHYTSSHSANYVCGRKVLAPDGSQLLPDEYEAYRKILRRMIIDEIYGEKGFHAVKIAQVDSSNIMRVLNYDNIAKLYSRSLNITKDDVKTINEATKKGHRMALNCLNGSTWKTYKRIAEELGIDTKVYDDPELGNLLMSEEDGFFNAGYIVTQHLEVANTKDKEMLKTTAKTGTKIKVTCQSKDMFEKRVLPFLAEANIDIRNAEFIQGAPKDGIVELQIGTDVITLNNGYGVDHLGIDTTMAKVARTISYPAMLKRLATGTLIDEGDPDSDRFVVKQIIENTPENMAIIQEFGIDYYDLYDGRILLAPSPNKFFLSLDIIDFERMFNSGEWDKYWSLYFTTYVSSRAWTEWAKAIEGIKHVLCLVGFKNLTALQSKIENWYYNNPEENEFTVTDQLGRKVTIDRSRRIRIHSKQEESGGRTSGMATPVFNLMGEYKGAAPEKSFADSAVSHLVFASNTYRGNKNNKKKAMGGDYLFLNFLKKSFKKYNLVSKIDRRIDILHGDQGRVALMPFAEQSSAKAKIAAVKTNFNNFWFSLGRAVRNKNITIEQAREILCTVLPEYRETWQCLTFTTMTEEPLAGGKTRPEGVPMEFEPRDEKTPMVTEMDFRPSGTDPFKSKDYLDAIKLDKAQEAELEKTLLRMCEYNLYEVLKHFGVESVYKEPEDIALLGLRALDLSEGLRLSSSAPTGTKSFPMPDYADADFKYKLILYSGPSATGKSPLWGQIQKLQPAYFERIVLYTSRKMGTEEQNGVDYNFRDAKEIEKLAKDNPGKFVTMNVNDDIQGLDLRDVEKAVKSGKRAIAEVSVDWAAKLRGLYPDIVYTIFISPLSDEQIAKRIAETGKTADQVIYDEMKERQIERNNDGKRPTAPAKQEKRAKNAIGEMARRNEYNAVLTSPDLRDISEHKPRWEGPEGQTLVDKFMQLINLAESNATKATKFSPARTSIDTSDVNTVYMLTGGGDCAGIDDMIANTIGLFSKDGAQVVGIKEAFKGAAAENFKDRKMPALPEHAEILKGLSSTEFESAREDPFIVGKTPEEINKKVNQLIKNLAGALITDKGDAVTAEDILDGTLVTRSGNEYDMRYILQKSKEDLHQGFLLTKDGRKMNVEDTLDADVITKKGKIAYMQKPFKGLIVTGGDDHLTVAWKLHIIGIRPVVAVPKSMDNDFWTQMLGFYTAFKKAQEEVWADVRSAITHHRACVIEIFGRSKGHVAFRSSQINPKDLKDLAKDLKNKIEKYGRSMIILIPEKPSLLESVLRKVVDVMLSKTTDFSGRETELQSATIAIAEGFSISAQDPVLLKLLELVPELKAKYLKIKGVDPLGNPKFAGVGDYIIGLLNHAKDIAAFIGDEGLIEKVKHLEKHLKDPYPETIRHELRGATPHEYDEALAKWFAELAYKLISEGKSGLVVTLDEGQSPYIQENFKPRAAASVIALKGTDEVVALEMGIDLQDKDYDTRQAMIKQHLDEINANLRKQGVFWKEPTDGDKQAELEQLRRLLSTSKDEFILAKVRQALMAKTHRKDAQEATTNLVSYRSNQYLTAVGSKGTADVIPASKSLFTPGHDAFEAVKKAGKALIAVNIVSYNEMLGHMLAAMQQNAGIIFEVARSQIGYAMDEVTTVKYVKEVAGQIGFGNPLVMHGDHIQYTESLFNVKAILKAEYEKVHGKGSYNDKMNIEDIDLGILQAVQQKLKENAEKERRVIEEYVERLIKAGFTSIAIDASTIFDEVASDAVMNYYRQKGTRAERLVVALEQSFKLPLEWGVSFLKLNPSKQTDRERFEFIKNTVIYEMKRRNRPDAEIIQTVKYMTDAFGILHRQARKNKLSAGEVIRAYEWLMKQVAQATVAGTIAVLDNMTEKEKLLLLPTSNAKETAHQLAFIDKTVAKYAPELIGHFGKEVEAGHVDKKVPNPRLGGKLEPKMTHPVTVGVMGEYLTSKGLSFDIIATNNGSGHGTQFDKKTLTPISQVGKISPWLTEELQKEAEKFNAAIAQHGTSGSDMDELKVLARAGVIKFNIATNYQQIILNALSLLDEKNLTPDDVIKRSISDKDALVEELHKDTREKIKQLAEAFKQDAKAAELKEGDSLFVEFIKRAYAWGVKKGNIKETSTKEDIATLLAKEFKRVFCDMYKKLYMLGADKYIADKIAITKEAERMFAQIREFIGLPIKTEASTLDYLRDRNSLFVDWDDVFNYFANIEFERSVYQARDVSGNILAFTEKDGTAQTICTLQQLKTGEKIASVVPETATVRAKNRPSEIRDVKDLSVAMVGQDAFEVTKNDARPAYFMQRGIFASRDHITLAFETPNKQRFDVTIMRPGVFGKEQELIHTSGHFHNPKWAPEIYQVVYGRAGYMLQKTNESLKEDDVLNPTDIEDAIMVEAEAGEPVVILPGYGHVSTNLSPDRPLVMVDWLTWDQSSQYGPFIRDAKDKGGTLLRDKYGDAIGVGGACWYAVWENGKVVYKPNRSTSPGGASYKSIPGLKVVKPAQEVAALGLKKGEPIYNIVNNPGVFSRLAKYLNEPLQDKFKDITPENVFVPVPEIAPSGHIVSEQFRGKLLDIQNILLSASPAEVNATHLDETSKALTKLNKELADIPEAIKVQNAVIDLAKLSAPVAKVESDAAVVFDSSIIPDEEQRLAVENILSQGNDILSALEDVLSLKDKDNKVIAKTKVVLLQDVDKVQLPKNVILISDAQKLEGAKLLDVKEIKNKEGYFPAATLIAMARGLISLNNNNFAKLYPAIKRLYEQLTQETITEELKQALKEGTWNVVSLIISMLPNIESYRGSIEQLQKQAFMALIAA